MQLRDHDGVGAAQLTPPRSRGLLPFRVAVPIAASGVDEVRERLVVPDRTCLFVGLRGGPNADAVPLRSREAKEGQADTAGGRDADPRPRPGIDLDQPAAASRCSCRACTRTRTPAGQLQVVDDPLGLDHSARPAPRKPLRPRSPRNRRKAPHLPPCEHTVDATILTYEHTHGVHAVGEARDVLLEDQVGEVHALLVEEPGELVDVGEHGEPEPVHLAQVRRSSESEAVAGPGVRAIGKSSSVRSPSSSRRQLRGVEYPRSRPMSENASFSMTCLTPAQSPTHETATSSSRVRCFDSATAHSSLVGISTGLRCCAAQKSYRKLTKADSAAAGRGSAPSARTSRTSRSTGSCPWPRTGSRGFRVPARCSDRCSDSSGRWQSAARGTAPRTRSTTSPATLLSPAPPPPLRAAPGWCRDARPYCR